MKNHNFFCILKKYYAIQILDDHWKIFNLDNTIESKYYDAVDNF